MHHKSLQEVCHGPIKRKLRRIIRQKEQEQLRQEEEHKERIRAYIELQERKKKMSEYCQKFLEPLQKKFMHSEFHILSSLADDIEHFFSICSLPICKTMTQKREIYVRFSTKQGEWSTWSTVGYMCSKLSETYGEQLVEMVNSSALEWMGAIVFSGKHKYSMSGGYRCVEYVTLEGYIELNLTSDSLVIKISPQKDTREFLRNTSDWLDIATTYLADVLSDAKYVSSYSFEDCWDR